MNQTPATPASVPHAPGRSAIRWRMLGLLFLASVVAYTLRLNMSIAGEAMSHEVGLSPIQLGVVLSAFAWGYTIFQFPGGVLGGRMGGRRALALLAVGWGVANLCVGLLPGPGVLSPTMILITLALLRFSMGALQAPLYPVTSGSFMCNWFPVSGWGFPNAVTNAGASFGGAATGALIAWLMQTIGWRASFLVTAPLGFVLAAAWWWYVRDTPAEHPGVRQEELALIDADRPALHCGLPEPGSWRAVLRNRDVLLLTVSYFLMNYVFYFFFNNLFTYLIHERGFTIMEGGVMTAAPWVCAAFGALFGGLVCDRCSRRFGARNGYRWPALVFLLASAVLAVGAAVAPGPLTAVALLSLCFAAQQASDPFYWAASVSIAGRHSSAATGVMNTAGNAVGGVGALLVPFTVERYGWAPALATGAACAVIAALLWLWIRADREIIV